MKSLLFLICALAAHAAEPSFRADVERIEWVGIEKDRVRIAVHVHLETKQKGAIRNLHFEHMTIAGMPFYLSPAPGRITFPSPGYYSIPVTIYLRDVASLAALEHMADTGTVALRGTARFAFELPTMGKIVLLSSTANVAYPIAKDVPLDVPGGYLARQAALAAIRTARKAEPLLALLRLRSRWERDLRQQVLPMIIPIETSFVVDAKESGPQTVTHSTIGFAMQGGKILTTGEAVEPWRYDAALAAAIAQHVVTVRKDSIQIRGPRGNLRLSHVTAEMESTFASPGVGRISHIQLAKRASNRNVAFLEATPAPGQLLNPAQDTANEWDRLAVFRISSGPNAKPELIFLGRRENDRIIFADPVDTTAFGSPVYSPAGLIGFVQDEHSAAILPLQ